MTHLPRATPWSYPALRRCLHAGTDARHLASWRGLDIASHFQPVVSLTHARVIGHEGLMRPVDADGQAIAPLALLGQAEGDAGSLMELDRLTRLLHIANAGEARAGWLFLNMHPRIFTTRRSGSQRGFQLEACREFGIAPGRIVIELLEQALHDETEFADAVRHIREHGYLVALDDFGAGHSNFDRVWNLSPEIVKLDRSFAAGAERDSRIRRLLPRIVALLHEAGVFVVLEGIENRAQAMIALDANVDFAQGWHFGRPQPDPLEIHAVVGSAAELWRNYDSDIVEQQRQTEARLLPYKEAVAAAVARIVAGSAPAAAFAAFLALPQAEFCYQLDSDGRQVGDNVWHRDYASGALGERFVPINNIGGARWSRRPYFRSAVAQPGEVQATMPYLSSSSAHLCITISLAFHVDGELRVACGDIAWQ